MDHGRRGRAPRGQVRLLATACEGLRLPRPFRKGLQRSGPACSGSRVHGVGLAVRTVPAIRFSKSAHQRIEGKTQDLTPTTECGESDAGGGDCEAVGGDSLIQNTPASSAQSDAPVEFIA